MCILKAIIILIHKIIVTYKLKTIRMSRKHLRNNKLYTGIALHLNNSCKMSYIQMIKISSSKRYFIQIRLISPLQASQKLNQRKRLKTAFNRSMQYILCIAYSHLDHNIMAIHNSFINYNGRTLSVHQVWSHFIHPFLLIEIPRKILWSITHKVNLFILCCIEQCVSRFL